VERTDTPFTNLFQEGQVIRIPIAHMEGNYFIAPEGLETLKAQRRVLFRYCDPQGRITDGANPNGSVDAIAGILNARGNVLGMMPHPERCAEAILGGGTDGLTLFQSILSHLGQRL
jgi:phosphoribosylformylglycinamidine synthase